jgi:dienelactone hydrolase
MRRRKEFKAFVAVLTITFGLWQCSLKEAFGQSTVVTFMTKDGWKLTGSLYRPQQASSTPAPAVVMLTEPGWVDRSIYDSYLAADLAEKGFFALNIDLRGSGSSLGREFLEEFSAEDMKGIQQDLRAAIEYLSSQPGIDPMRIGVVGAGASSEYAVLEASVNPRIQALVLISGTLSQAAKEYLKSENSVPLLGVVGKDDKKSFRELAQAYALSSNRSSDFLPAVGHGAVMFSHTEGLEAKVVHWMEHNLKALGTEKEISFRSEDGLTLHGTLRLPDGATAGAKVPGVVLVHGAKHDQQTYHFMAREIAKHGMATLRFDWRGKARSENGGSTTNVDRVDLDVKAAIQLLASQPVVDSNRIGLVAATAGTGHALRAANGDTRIQTMVLLTVASVPEGDAKQFLTTSGKPILAIASMEDINYNRGSLADSTREAYLLSNSEGSEFLLYDDAGRGSEILKVKPELEPMILRWLDDKLQGIPPTRVHGQE